MNVERDLVFVDQRGTGRSNELVCPPPPAGVDLDQDASALTTYVRRCLAGIDADPAFYTTAMYVDDVADVVAALEYDQVNLYGGSYGATVAQVFLRRHDELVRTMTLSGGTLLDLPIFELIAQNSAGALEAVFTRCAADATCSTAFPRVRGEWQQLLDDVAAAGSYYGHAMLTASRWWQRACGMFPRSNAAADYGEARVTDVPVLNLNGDADPQDPPANMVGAGSIWPNSRQLVEPGQAHGISAWPCRASVIAAFIEQGAGDGVDATCLDTVPVPRFSTAIGG